MNKVLLIDIGGTNLRYAYSDGDFSTIKDTNKIQLSCIKGFNEITNCYGILYKIEPFNDICMLGEK